MNYKKENKKTYQPKGKEIERKWHLFDAKGKVLGRLASEIARLLMGKHKVKYANHLDMGDFVIVINAKEVRLTGRKKSQKVYRSHSGYPGGFKEVSFKKMLEEHPERIIQKAVYGMLPDNRLRSNRMNRLKVFPEKSHPYKKMFGKGEK